MTTDELLAYLKSGEFDEIKSIECIECINNTLNANSQLSADLEKAETENTELRERNMKLFLMLQDGETSEENNEDNDEVTVESFIDEMLKE